MSLITAMVLALAIGGGEQTQAPRPKSGDRLTTAPRPLTSTSARPLASVGTNRALISTGTDRGLISTGTDRGLVSTGTDRGLASTGGSRPLVSSGRDRALVPTGGLEQQPPATGPSVDAQSSPGVSVPPGGAQAAPAPMEGTVIVASANALPAPPAVRAPSRFATQLGEAKQAMEMRDFSRAEQVLYSVRSAELSAWDVRLRYASNLVALGHYDRSLTELTAALKNKSKEDALPATTDLFGSKEVFAETLKQLKDYRSGNAADSQALLLEAMLEGMNGNQPQAASLLGEARQRHPGWEPIDLIDGVTATPTPARTDVPAVVPAPKAP
jgi:hypothetical protein